MDQTSNPFRDALAETTKADIGLTGRDEASAHKQLKLRTVADLDVASPEMLKKSPKIAQLTVQDLDDLASEFGGVPTANAKVAELSLEDLVDLETVFFQFKAGVGRELRRTSVDSIKGTSVDVSCCCCTPCCCCAATDMSETA